MEIIITALYWSASVLTVFALATGIGLLLAPAQLRELARPLDRWRSLRPMLGQLDKPHYTERQLYHRHRLVGGLIVAGAGYTLLRLSGIDHQATLGVGLVVYFRPSLLKHLETRSNHWLSTRQAIKPLDVSHGELNALLWSRPRTTGIILVLGSLYIWSVLLAYRHGIL